MTFLNPAFLFGLVAAAIPVVLHLISLRRLRTVEFSTLSFLKELQQTRIRRLKLRQLLLLILRTVLILLIVLAFSRPTIKGSLGAESTVRATTTAAIVIDDSNSMTASDQQGLYLTQAREAAQHVLGLLGEGDEVSLLRLSEVSPGESHPGLSPLRDFGILHSRIQDVATSSIHRHLEDALRILAGTVSSSKNFNKEVYVISDFQQGVIAPARAKEPPREQLYPPDVRFFLMPIGSKELQNFGIESASVENSIIELNKPFLLRVKVGNHSAVNVTSHMVSVFLNGTRVAQKGIDALSGQTIETEFSLIPRTNGFLDGFAELEDDDLSYDNRFYFSLHLPETIRVLLVGAQTDLRYVQLALATRSDASSLRVRTLGYDRLTASTLVDQDVIILTNPGRLPSLLTDQIAAFVRNGGGLLLFPGPETTPEAYRDSFTSLKLPPLRMVETLSNSPGQASFVGIEGAELRHPLFEGMFETPQPSARTTPSLESPRITTFGRFEPTAEATVIVSMSNGAPFLLDIPRGSGRVLLCSVSATPQWSDFPLKGLFVPLLHRSLSYLTQEQVKQQSVVAGDPITLTSSVVGSDRLSVRTPDGMDVDVPLSRSGTTTSAVFHETLQPGIYSVRNNSVVQRKFSVNMDPDESKTARAEDGTIKTMFDRLGVSAGMIRTIDNPSETDRVVLQSRFGVELWKYFLIGALILAIVEMLVARDVRTKADLHPNPGLQ